LVLGEIPSLRELWDGAARFVDPGDEHGLARALQELIDDPTERHRAARRAQERARRYRSDTMTSAYAALYRRLTAPDSPREQNPRPPLTEEPLCAS
jgi:glycosyltransferase involved in cell wall biosynthesis